jgi:hypothetical protein
MVNFLSEKCYLKFHVGKDKPNQGKTRTKEKKKSKPLTRTTQKQDNS